MNVDQMDTHPVPTNPIRMARLVKHDRLGAVQKYSPVGIPLDGCR